MRYVLALLLAGIAFAVYAQSSSKSSDVVGRYTVVAIATGAWKLDTATGELTFCAVRDLSCFVAK